MLLFLCLVYFSAINSIVHSQEGSSGVINSSVLPGRHRGAVTALLRDAKGRYLSAGEDGFIGIWNNQAVIDRFQAASHGISAMILRPGMPHVAIVEDDGFSVHRISLWDYEARKNIFTLRLVDSVSFINFSAAGNYIIASLGGQTGLVFIDAETGGIYEPLKELSERVNFAATSLSERVVILYSASGILSYWDLEAGIELQRFEVPPNIRTPVLFGNNCFIAGFDPSGLVIIDAVTGLTLARDNRERGSIFFDDPNNVDSRGRVRFFCFSVSGTAGTIASMEVSPSGSLAVLSRMTVPAGIAGITCAASGGGNDFILANNNGELWFWNRTAARLLESASPELITDFSASSEALGFITEHGTAGFLPLDYSRLRNGDELRLEEIPAPAAQGAYTQISSGPSSSGGGRSSFLFWQYSRAVPMLKTLQGPPLGAGGPRVFLDKLPLRFPIRSAEIFGSNILFLNTQGAISVLNSETGNLQFSYTAAGAQDAVFFDSNIILIGRNAATGGAPFMAVNTATGETVPLAYPAMIGLKVYRGSSGAAYGAVVSHTAGEMLTSLIRLNTNNPSGSEKLAEYSGEDSSFFISESRGNPAFNLGGGSAFIFRNQNREKITVERSRGLPQKAADGGGRLIILDGEGAICWHDGNTGKLLAVFNLYKAYWTLNTNGTIISGTIAPTGAAAP